MIPAIIIIEVFFATLIIIMIMIMIMIIIILIIIIIPNLYTLSHLYYISFAHIYIDVHT